jgi:hypothetical protein
MTTKAWSHLPNAKHIDWVLETLEKNTKVWDAARYRKWNAARSLACYVAFGALWDAARSDEWKAATDAVWDAERSVAQSVVWGAIDALVAWDYFGELLDMQVEEVIELAKAGDYAAVLLLPAVIVKNKLKDKNT